MITVVVDLKNPNSIVVPDGLCNEFVLNLIEKFNKDKNPIKVEIGTDVLLNCFRIAILKGNINLNEIEIKTPNEKFEINEYGKIIKWPKDYESYSDATIEELLLFQSKKVKENANNKA